MNSKKKLVLSTETLATYSLKSGIKAGAVTWAGCTPLPPAHTLAKGCVVDS